MFAVFKCLLFLLVALCLVQFIAMQGAEPDPTAAQDPSAMADLGPNLRKAINDQLNLYKQTLESDAIKFIQMQSFQPGQNAQSAQPQPQNPANAPSTPKDITPNMKLAMKEQLNQYVQNLEAAAIKFIQMQSTQKMLNPQQMQSPQQFQSFQTNANTAKQPNAIEDFTPNLKKQIKDELNKYLLSLEAAAIKGIMASGTQQLTGFLEKLQKAGDGLNIVKT